MKFDLTREEKLALLKAASIGILDTNDIPRLYIEISHSNAFLELMIETTDDDNEE